MCNITHLAVSRYHIPLVLLSVWFPVHCLETPASRCSLRLVQVCLNLAAKTMRKGRNDPRNHPRKATVGELKALQAGAIICPDTLPCSTISFEDQTRRGSRAEDTTCSDGIGLQLGVSFFAYFTIRNRRSVATSRRVRSSNHSHFSLHVKPVPMIFQRSLSGTDSLPRDLVCLQHLTFCVHLDAILP
jgi:hypothetical protein